MGERGREGGVRAKPGNQLIRLSLLTLNILKIQYLT